MDNPQPSDPSSRPPQQQPQPVPQQSVVAPTAYAAPPAGKQSLLWLWISLPIVALFIIGGVLFFLFAYPAIQARGVANSFMDAVAKDDDAKMKQLSDSGRDTLTQKATAGLKGATYSISDVKNKDDLGYVVNFDVKNSANLKDTTVVVKKGKVTTFNINTKGGSTATVETPTSPTAVETPSRPSQCLTADIVRKSSSSGYAPNPYKASGYQGGFTVFFGADSAEYDPEIASVQMEDINTFAAWAKQYRDRKFHVELAAKVQEGSLSAAGSQLATSRVNKLKKDLTDRGVLESKITIMPNVAETGDSAFSQSARRNVNLSIIGDC